MKKITFILFLIASTMYGQNCPDTIGSQSSTTVPAFNITPAECNTYPATITIDGVVCTLKSCQGSILKYDATSPLPSSDTFTVDFGNGVVCTYVNGALQTLSNQEFEVVKEASILKNPINKGENLEFILNPNQETIISIYNITGKLLLTKLVNGSSQFSINVDNFKSGVYLVNIVTNHSNSVKKLVVL